MGGGRRFERGLCFLFPHIVNIIRLVRVELVAMSSMHDVLLLIILLLRGALGECVCVGGGGR